MEGIFEDVRILVSADPAQAVHLKRPMLHIRKKRGELEAADIERNADFAQLLLYHRDHQARIRVRRSLHGDVKANAIYRRIPCLLQ